jgi:hypothetical protein
MRPDLPEQRPALRRLLAALVAIDLLFLFYIFADDRQIGAAHGALTGFADVVSGTAGSIAVVAVGLAGALGFARRPGRIAEGLVALVALGILNTAHAQLFGSPWRHLFFSGVCLAGWLLGLAVTRLRGAPQDESYARLGSIALLGAAYLSAGISKLSFGGPGWLSGLPIRAAIVAQDGLVPDSLITIYRGWIVGTPWAASAFAIATVGFELAGPLMILGRRTRAVVALGLVAMHFNIFVLMPILYWESMVLLLAFGLSADGPGTAASPAAAPGGRRFQAVAAALALCAAAAILHQAARHARVRALQQAAASAPAPPPPAAPADPSRARLGPFAVGQRIAGGWTVERLEVRDDELVVALSDGRPARFGLTCAASEHQGAFDIGAAHIFYSKDRTFDEMQVPGQALRAMVQAAAGDRDPCALFDAWRAAARRP